MNVLVTGGRGFLGKYIVKHLNSICKSVDTLGLSKYNTVCHNLKYKIVTKIKQYDLIVHTAGKAHNIPKTDFEKNEFFQLNVIGTQNLLENLTIFGLPKYFVLISSVSVYGLNSGVDINETNTLSASDPYGLSKIEAEKVVLDWCNMHNVVCSILRLPLIVGENPPGNLGAMIKGIQMGYYFNIAGGKAKKSMVLAEDVAEHILKVAKIGGIFNLTDGYHPSFSELSNKISSQISKTYVPNLPKILAILLAKFGDLFGNKFPINSDKLVKITSTLTFDDTKARIAFGWNPSPVLDSFKVQQDAK